MHAINIEKLLTPCEVWDTEKKYEAAKKRYKRHTPKRIVVHNSWSPTAAEFKGDRTIQGILNYHLNKGYSYISYHYIISPAGDKIYCGRPVTVVGAHCGGELPAGVTANFENTGSVGICIIGNYDTETIDPEASNTLLNLLQWLQEKYTIPPKEVYGHCEQRSVSHKTCPGKKLFIELFGENRWTKIKF